MDNKTKIVNQSSNFSTIVNYDIDKAHNDSLFTYFDGEYHRYKKNIRFISIFVKENYATDNDGKHL